MVDTKVKPDETIQETVLAVMNAVNAVEKGDVNTHQHFKFRGIDAVMNALGPAFRKYGLIAVPIVEECNAVPITGRNGMTMTSVRLRMRVTFFNRSGESMDAVVWGEAFDAGDKATAKAHSVAIRTAFLQTFCLPTDEPDPDHDSYERGPAQAPRQRPQASDEQCERKFEELKSSIQAANSNEALSRLWPEADKFGLVEALTPFIVKRRKQLSGKPNE